MGRLDDAGHGWTPRLRICEQQGRSSSLLVSSEKSSQPRYKARSVTERCTPQGGHTPPRTATEYHSQNTGFITSTASWKQHVHTSTRSRRPITRSSGRRHGAAPAGSIRFGADCHASGVRGLRSLRAVGSGPRLYAHQHRCHRGRTTAYTPDERYVRRRWRGSLPTVGVE